MPWVIKGLHCDFSFKFKMGKKDEESNNKVEKKPVIFNSNFLQVLLLSFAFMLIFTAFQTTEIIEVRYLNNKYIQSILAQ